MSKFSDRSEFPLPYVVFLDLKLPTMNGLQLLKWIRARPEFHSLVVIVLTSSQQPEDIHAAYQFHANAYIVKPSGLEKLVPMVQAIKDFWFTQNQPDPLPSVPQEVVLS
jgi:two-component system response regulator